MLAKLALPAGLRAPTLVLGVTQIIAWGTTMYAPAVVATPIVEDTGWSRTAVFGAFSASLVLGALLSRRAGALIDRFGGRAAMAAGSALIALGLALAAAAPSLPVYFAAWALLGLAMRLGLYEAAFATLTAVGGRDARRAISVLTLFGGLASTVFWPIGWQLVEAFGWRGTFALFALFNLLVCLPLHLAFLPRAPRAPVTGGQPAPAGTSGDAVLEGSTRRLALALLTVAFALMMFVNSALSAHIIDTLVAFDLPYDLAVSIASLRGVGQVAGRLWEILFAASLPPVGLCLVAVGLTPLALVPMMLGAGPAVATFFSFGQGASNGLVTIARGVVPLLLFGPRGYGTLVGTMAAPALMAAALAPAAQAAIVDISGYRVALGVDVAAAVLAFALVLLLGARLRLAEAGRAG